MDSLNRTPDTPHPPSITASARISPDSSTSTPPVTIDRYSLITPDRFHSTYRGTVVVVGAGGIGARVLPMLVKILRPAVRVVDAAPAWTVIVVDPDRVEERNLLRQPFTPSDVGKFKAQVMTERYTSPEVPVVAWTTTVQALWEQTVARDQGFGDYLVLLGCVDNIAARAFMLHETTRNWGYHHIASQRLYIDAGNDGNRGQVVLASGSHTCTLLDGNRQNIIFEGHKAFPDVFAGEDNAEPSCGLRVDTQTPLANNMAAALMLNYLGAFVYGEAIGTIGMNFSTLGGVAMLPGRVNAQTYSWQPAAMVRAEDAQFETERAKMMTHPLTQRALAALGMSEYPRSLDAQLRVRNRISRYERDQRSWEELQARLMEDHHTQTTTTGVEPVL